MRNRWFVGIAVLALTMLRSADAGPLYYAVHNADTYGNTGPINVIGPQSTPIDYEFPYQVT